LYNALAGEIVLEFGFRMKTKKLLKTVKFVIRGLPLAGAAAATLLPLQQPGQQFRMLIVLLWIQLFFISEVFLAGK
jgi:hypothetical protein